MAQIKQMKQYYLLLLAALCLSTSTNAQIVVSKTLLKSWNKAQVDSFLQKKNIPPALVGTRYGVDMYKVIYNTVTFDSSAITASGLLCVPNNAGCGLPIISYDHGTIAKKSDAPSQLKGDEILVAILGASTGYISTEPDYLGLGDGPGFHYYIHAATEATATIDMIRAAREVSGTLGMTWNRQLFLMGYSQGGHAAMATHKMIQEKLPNEMTVTRSVPMSGPYDVSGVQAQYITSNTPYSSPSYLPFVLFSYNRIYKFYDNIADALVSPYDTLLPPLFNGNYSTSYIDSKMPAIPNTIIKPAIMDSFRNDPNHYLRKALADNNVYDWKPEAPMRLYFCSSDEAVNYLNAIVAIDTMRANGTADIDTLNISNTLSHPDCAQPAIANAKFFFDEARINPFEGTVVQASATATDITAKVAFSGGIWPFTYAWQGGSTDSTSNAAASGSTYTVTVTDATGCSITISKVLNFTGLAENTIAASITMSPNPANNYIQVTVGDNKTYSLKVLNVQGELLQHIPLTKEAKLDVSNMGSGMYLMLISDESRNLTTKRFIVQH
jgi:hypothetical protein